ncbi:MAG: SDR family oxidoreductase [Odoribacter sp.]
MEYPCNSLLGKTLLITGCNRGIGKCAITLFAERGVNIIACLREFNEEFTDFFGKLAKKYSITTQILYFDLRDEVQIKAAFQILFKQKVIVDILINNAGVATGSFLQMTSMIHLKDVFQINFFSQVLVTQFVSKLMMKNKKGCIINMGSVAGLENLEGYTAYGSSKAAIMFFTKTLAAELASYNIRVNAIAPGLIATDMANQMKEKAWREMMGRSDMKRLGKPEEIVKLMLYLASDDASFITGQIIRVDGGM